MYVRFQTRRSSFLIRRVRFHNEHHRHTAVSYTVPQRAEPRTTFDVPVETVGLRPRRKRAMGFFSKDIKTMDDLFVHTLRDIYYAEKQILQALPEMIEKADDPQL